MPNRQIAIRLTIRSFLEDDVGSDDRIALEAVATIAAIGLTVVVKVTCSLDGYQSSVTVGRRDASRWLLGIPAGQQAHVKSP